jgi:hypothetical protein
MVTKVNELLSCSCYLAKSFQVENDRDSLLTLLRGTIELFAKMSAAGAHPVDLLPSRAYFSLHTFDRSDTTVR